MRREHFAKVQSASIVSTLSSVDGTDAMAEKPDGEQDKSDVSRASSQDSLVPADDSSSQALGTSFDDTASFVQVNSRAGIASPPCSLMSVEDLVVVSKNIRSD